MKINRLLLVAALVVVPAVAMAQTTTVVSVSPIWTYVEPTITAVASAIVLFLITLLANTVQKYLKVSIDASNRDALHSAIMSGINLGLDKVGGKVNAANLDVKNAVVAEAINWVETSVPGALAHFGITPDAIAALATAKLQALLEPGAAATATATVPATQTAPAVTVTATATQPAPSAAA